MTILRQQNDHDYDEYSMVAKTTLVLVLNRNI
jgi:hypothetical protein